MNEFLYLSITIIIGLIGLLGLVYRKKVEIEIIDIPKFDVLKVFKNFKIYYDELVYSTTIDPNLKSEIIKVGDVSTVIDYEKLKDYYKKVVKNHRKKGRRLIIQCYITFAFQFLICTGFIFSGLIEFTDNLMLLLLCQEALFIWCIISFFKRISKPLNLEVEAESISQDSFPEIWELVFELKEKMELDSYALKLYYIGSSDVTCFVDVDKSLINLFLTRGFVINMEKSKKDCESILAHEFGHVYQGDNKLFLVNKAVFSIPAIIIVVSLFIWFFVGTLSLVTGNGIPTLSGGISIIYLITLFTLSEKKAEAENLADLASIVFVKNSSIQNVISGFLEKLPIKYSIRNARLRYIQNTLAKFKVDSVNNI